MQPITKAIIAAAGFGTRFLPQTKAMPKEMLPLVDKPIIQYVVEELVSVGIEDIVIVTGYNKRSIEDHFDRPNEDLAANLKNSSKQHLLDEIEAIANLANFVYLRQKGPYGNGTPLINAEHLIGNEPFIYTWSDDFIMARPPRFRQMIDAYQEFKCPILSAIQVHRDSDYAKYGFATGRTVRDGLIDIEQLIEKPGIGKIDSNLATVSGYILTPDVFTYLHHAVDNLKPGDELYSNNALKLMLEDHQRLVACEISDGRYFDAGNKLDYVKANIEIALLREDMRAELIDFMQQQLNTNH